MEKIMKTIKITIIALLLVGYFAVMFPFSNISAQKSLPNNDAEITKARNAADGLFQRVRGLLMEKMKDGNFVEAAEVCSNVAQNMTKEFAEEQGADVYRVSLKLRNSLNRPDKFEKKHLKMFDRLRAENQPVEEYSEVVGAGDKRMLRYMKPVIIQESCLKCHGDSSQIPAEVRKILFEKYPKDKATGYKIGDVRGAISVRIPLFK
jgi:hypothetical protein